MGMRGEGRTAVVLLVAGFAVVALALVALGNRYLKSGPPSPIGAAAEQSPAPDPRERSHADPELSEMFPLERTRATVSAVEGGIASAPAGIARLEIPPDALPESTTIELQRYYVDQSNDLTGNALDLLPDGLQLSRPARLTFSVPQGLTPDQVEISVYDRALNRWVPEGNQRGGTVRDQTISAEITHFSLRRLKIRPGMVFPSALPEPRAVARLESDESNFFERYIAARWRGTPKSSGGFRELVEMGRLGRLELIRSGRLRAVASSADQRPWRDDLPLASLPADHPAGTTGWVRLERLDAQGRATGRFVVAELRGDGPRAELQRGGVIVELSRASLEALGLFAGVDFGVDPVESARTFVAAPAGGGSAPRPYLPIRVTAAPAPVSSSPR